jgi:hypothetical protein
VSAELHSLAFSGALLARGFWLYVWEVVNAGHEPVLYVGRTGDSSSPNAQSPFTRLSQHLGINEHANALRHNLTAAGIDVDTCRSFEIIAYGPIFLEASCMDEHLPLRDKVAALEKKLRDALKQSGYNVLNEVRCQKPLDAELWEDARNAFSARFPRLAVATEARSGA